MSLVNVPILLPGREPYGVLQVDLREPREFGQEDIQFLRTYAMVLGPVIDRLHKARDLVRTSEKYRLIVENARDYAIFLTDEEDIITDWLPGAAAVFGWTEKEVLGKPSEILFTPEDREAGQPEKEFDTARREGKAPNVRWHIRKDGTRVFIDGQTTALKSPDGTIHGFMKIGQDVTQRRKWEEQQQVLVAELQHRTRNIIAVVRSLCDKTAQASADLADFRSRFRDRLGAFALVQGLLSRLESNDGVAFEELIAAQLAAMDAHGERVKLDGPRGVKLRSSTVQILALALHELATNAVKYGALSQPHASLTIAWRLEPNGADGTPWLHIEWREAGVVISPETRTIERRGQGRELIERALPYQLGASTRYALGSEGVHCTVSIPVARSTVARRGLMAERTLSDCRVLVAEDEYLVAEELRSELVAAGVVVAGPVARVRDALDLITREAKIDAAILDINLRGEMVFPAADLLIERGVPFVFTTGYDVSVIPKRFENVVVCKKPTSMSAVVKAIGRLVHA